MADFSFEKDLLKRGYTYICGIDEAGRGPFAGPVVAAAVILKVDTEILGLDDSKKIKSETKRQSLYNEIIEKAVDYSIFSVDNTEINKNGILNATFKAMREAVLNLKIKPDYLLIDGNLYRNFDDFDGECIEKGDSKSLSISAASILAKVTRDNFMKEISTKYPEYNFAKHKGYGTTEHRQALKQFGPCDLHRTLFIRNHI